MITWQTKTLGDICEYDRRISDDHSLPYLSMEQIESGTGRIIGELVPAATQSSSFEFSDEHVLYGRLRPYLNKVALPVIRGRCSTEIFPLKPSPSVAREFLFYWLMLSETVSAINRTSTGTRMPRANMNAVAVLPFSFPALTEQLRIVAMLNEVFEGIAKATANAKRNLANARELIDGTSEALITNAAPHAERVSLNTLLERGWIVGHLDGNHGSDYPRKEEFLAEGVPYISANAIDDDEVDMAAAKYLAEGRAERIRKGVAQHGDVLFAHNATVGPVAVLNTTEPRVILGTSLTYYRCNPSNIDNRYLAHYMRSRLFRAQYEQVMRQSTRNQVPITKQREFFHIIPPIGAQREISRRLDDLDAASRNLRRLYAERVDQCAKLGQAILHKAFSGQLTSKETIAVASKAATAVNNAPEFTADILAFAYSRHAAVKRERTLGRVKAQKILHLVESVGKLDLGREPIKDAAGPNDSAHMRRAEQWAAEHGYFTFVQRNNGGYDFRKGKGFDRLLAGTYARLASDRDAISRVIDLLVPMDSEEAEVLATVHAAWNNLLIDGIEPTRQAILREARQNWNPSKLRIPEAKFENAIRFIRQNDLIPDGSSKAVRETQERLFD